MPHWIRVYIVPAAVFQAVLIGGGYGTGRETVEFVTQAGPGGGVVAVGCFFLAMTAVLMASFEFARTFATFDYRHFFKQLLGPAWWLYEILAIALLILVLAVVISATATMADNWFGIPAWATTVGVILLTGAVLYVGQAAVETLLTVWAGLFSAFLIMVVLYALSQQHVVAVQAPWTLSSSARGFQYAFYNMAAIPILLYTIKGLRSRREAILAALCAGLAGALPALLMHLALSAHLPEILDKALPLMYVIDVLDQPWISYTYAFLLVGTIAQTAIGSLEGVIQRLNGWRQDQHKDHLTKPVRALLGSGVLVLATTASTVGVVALIGAGYGTLAWGFLLLYAFPVLTLGLWKIRRHHTARQSSA